MTYHTEYGEVVNRTRYGGCLTLWGMAKRTVQDILWDNLAALMRDKWGKENLNELVRKTRIGPGSATRLKKRDTSIGIGLLEKLAKPFSVQPWMLLFPFEGAEKLLEFCRVWEQADKTGREVLTVAVTAALQARNSYGEGTDPGRAVPPHGRGVGSRPKV